MIADKKTNMVYFSSLIKTKYPLFWQKLEEILQGTTEFFPGLTIPYSMLEGTRSVWCRDYMPIQKDTHKFVQFTYFPDYLLDPKYIHEITIPDEIKRLKIYGFLF